MAITKPKLSPQLEKLTISTQKKIDLTKFSCDYKAKATKAKSKKEIHDLAGNMLEESRQSLIEAQEKLWACKKYGVLVVLQGMDTSGKDGAIRHILSGVNPQGCRIQGFKVPSSEEHSHHFLWRYQKVAPARGEIVVFNRSHYEDVLAVKVHPEYMEELPSELSLDQNKKFWQDRYEDINNFERHLARNGIVILKFYLHISKAEQKIRLLERLNTVDKLWKISPNDLKERQFWDKYTEAYEALLANTGTDYAPWIVVPANDKKIARTIIGRAIADAINNLNLSFPQLSEADILKLKEAKRSLESEND